MTVPNPSSNAHTINRQPDQARAHLDLDDSTRHRLPGGLVHNAPDQDDWPLGSDNPAFGPLPIPYTTCTSSVRPHLPFHHNHLPTPDPHTDDQLAVWLQHAHETSREQFIPLPSAIPHNVGIFKLRVHSQPDTNNHPLRHTETKKTTLLVRQSLPLTSAAPGAMAPTRIISTAMPVVTPSNTDAYTHDILVCWRICAG